MSLKAVWLGRIGYQQALDLQHRLAEERKLGQGEDTLLLLEHPRTLTLGRAAKGNHILLSPEALQEQGFEVHEVGRGGDVTYHGPGQLVAYPILALPEHKQDVRKYVQSLEETMIRLCALADLKATRIDKFNGTWIDAEGSPRKIGAVGVRIARWVTTHGFAFNVSTNLNDFGVIVPCGITDKGVTSLRQERPEYKSDVKTTAKAAAKIFAELHERAFEWHEDTASTT